MKYTNCPYCFTQLSIPEAVENKWNLECYKCNGKFKNPFIRGFGKTGNIILFITVVR